MKTILNYWGYLLKEFIIRHRWGIIISIWLAAGVFFLFYGQCRYLTIETETYIGSASFYLMIAGILVIVSPLIYLGAYFVWEKLQDHLQDYKYWKRAAINSDKKKQEAEKP
jgi:hypothetical protein